VFARCDPPKPDRFEWFVPRCSQLLDVQSFPGWGQSCLVSGEGADRGHGPRLVISIWGNLLKIKMRLLTAASAAVLCSGAIAMSGGSAGAALAPIDVTNHTLHCNSVVGTMKFSPALTLLTPVAGETITLKATATGCTDPNDANVKIAKGAVTATLAASTSNCTSLAGLSAVTPGPVAMDWSVAAGAAKLLPTTLVGTALKMRSVLHMNQDFGGTYTTAWGAYGMFQTGIDAPHGSTAAPSVSGEFTNGDGGILSTLDMVTGQDTVGILGSCLSTTGVKALNVSLGGFSLQ
jgi:hypothetical protein